MRSPSGRTTKREGDENKGEGGWGALSPFCSLASCRGAALTISARALPSLPLSLPPPVYPPLSRQVYRGTLTTTADGDGNGGESGDASAGRGRVVVREVRTDR